MIQPRSCHLRREDSRYHQCGVELGTDDSGVECHARQHYARATASVCSNSQIEKIKSPKPRETACERYRKNFDNAASANKSNHHPQRNATDEIQF